MSAAGRVTVAAVSGGSAAAIAVGAIVAAPGVVADVAFIAGAVVAAAIVRAWQPRRWAISGIGFAVVFALAASILGDSVTDVVKGAFLVAVAALVAWAAARPLDTSPDDGAAATLDPIRPYALSAAVVGGAAVVVYTLFSLERHRRFGSGSWDYGCYVHNAWLFAHGEAFSSSARSAVLGDVAFWGGTNHFMPSLVFTAPIAWVMEASKDTSALSVAQNIVVAATVFPLALLARARGLPWPLATILVAGFLLHPGVQAALLFDVHEVAPVPALMATALALATSTPSRRRVVAFAVALFVLAGTKESSWLVAMSVAAAVAVTQPRWRRVALAAAAVSLVGFVVVVGVVQPGLLEPGATMMHAARFPGVGPVPASSLSTAAWSYLTHPGQTVLAVFQPLIKLRTLTTSTLAMGGLPWASGAGVVAGLSAVAERFLSDKQEMWSLAFHYGLVTAGWMAIAAVDVVAAARPRRRAALIAALLCGYALAATTSTRPFDLSTFEQPYYASAAQVDRYRRAIALVNDDDAVVAQNHFLPHLAARKDIWQPERRFIPRADVVILDEDASPWPHSPRHVQQLIASLTRDATFDVVFHEDSTWVFRRRP